MDQQRLSLTDLAKFIAGKKIYLWGSMIVGQGACRSLERNRIKVEAFVDGSIQLQGNSALGYNVLDPQVAIAAVLAGTAVIIICSGHYDNEIAAQCMEKGLQPDKDFILSRQLNDIDPSVDVSGMCNLHCISCPWGNMQGLKPGGFMKPAVYQQVLSKLLREIPLLGSIQLYAWGEPLLNPDLPEIIKMTREACVLAALSTNLNYANNLQAVIQAKPDWFKVSCSGMGADYERTHTGAKWETFAENLERLQHLREAYHPSMQVVLNYHVYKHNTGTQYEYMQQLCKEKNFIFRPNHAYLYSLDNVMDYAQKKEVTPQAKETMDMLLLSLDEGIQRARDQKDMPCAEERCLPINYDLRVRECGVYIKGFISDNFLNDSLEDILQRKKKSALCKKCKNSGLHRYTGVYLEEKICTQANENSEDDK